MAKRYIYAEIDQYDECYHFLDTFSTIDKESMILVDEYDDDIGPTKKAEDYLFKKYDKKDKKFKDKLEVL